MVYYVNSVVPEGEKETGNGGEVGEEEREEVMERWKRRGRGKMEMGMRRERGSVSMAGLWLPLYTGLQNNAEV